MLFNKHTGLCGVININIEDGQIHNFTSPGYPLFYPNNFLCEWFITASDEDTVILVHVNFFDIERGYDFLRFGNKHNVRNRSSLIAELTGKLSDRMKRETILPTLIQTG